MVQPREEQLGNITVLDEDNAGTVTTSGSNITDAGGVIHDELGGTPGNNSFWVENTSPSLPKFTDSAGSTITLGGGGDGYSSDGPANRIQVSDGSEGFVAGGLSDDGSGFLSYEVDASVSITTQPSRGIALLPGIGGDAFIFGQDISLNASAGSGISTIQGADVALNAQVNDVSITAAADLNITVQGAAATWPTANGSGVLTNNGSGTLSWAAPVVADPPLSDVLAAGNSTGTGQDISMSSGSEIVGFGNPVPGGNGGNVALRGGQGLTSGNGGSITLTGGNGGSSGDCGSINIQGGTSGWTDAPGGSVTIQASGGRGAGNGGSMLITGGSKITAGLGNAGSAQLSGGNGGSVGDGGNVIIAGGISTTGTCGDATIRGGFGFTGGNVTILGGTSTGTSVGGGIVMSGGNSPNVGNFAGGQVIVEGGLGTSTGTSPGGELFLRGGESDTGNNNGGDANLQGGLASGTGNGGDVRIRGGSSPSGSVGSVNIDQSNGSTAAIFDDSTDWAGASVGDVLVKGATGLEYSAITDSPGDFTVNGKLTVTGLIDPTGMVFSEQGTSPYDPSSTGTEGMIWVRDDAKLIYSDKLGNEFPISNDGYVDNQSSSPNALIGKETINVILEGISSVSSQSNDYDLPLVVGGVTPSGTSENESKLIAEIKVGVTRGDGSDYSVASWISSWTWNDNSSGYGNTDLELTSASSGTLTMVATTDGGSPALPRIQVGTSGAADTPRYFVEINLTLFNVD